MFSEWLPGSFVNYSPIKLYMEFVVELSLIGGLQREKQVECGEHKGSQCGRGNGSQMGQCSSGPFPQFLRPEVKTRAAVLSEAPERKLLPFPALGVTWFLSYLPGLSSYSCGCCPLSVFLSCKVTGQGLLCSFLVSCEQRCPLSM